MFSLGEVQKDVNLVDLVKIFQTSLYLQKSASFKPRTSPARFGSPTHPQVLVQPRTLASSDARASLQLRKKAWHYLMRVSTASANPG